MKKTISTDTHKLPEFVSKLLIDADLLPLITQAENGCIESQQELFLNFADGIFAKQDYQIAEYYLDLALDTIDKNYNGHIKGTYTVLWNKVQLAHLTGNTYKTQELFLDMVEFMRKNIPLAEWDYSQFEFMRSILDSENLHEE